MTDCPNLPRSCEKCGLINAPEGPRYVTLFSYAEGTTDMDEEQAFMLGKALAELHIVSGNFNTNLDRYELDASELLDNSITRLKEFLGPEWEVELSQLELLANDSKEKIVAIEKTAGTYGVIGGDVHGYNQHFTSNNQLTMFDFEFCAYGYHVYDIATFRWSRGSDDEALWTAFLNGYQSVRKLTNTELEAIDAFVVARHLWWMQFLTDLKEYQYHFNKEFWGGAFGRLLNKPKNKRPVLSKNRGIFN